MLPRVKPYKELRHLGPAFLSVCCIQWARVGIMTVCTTRQYTQVVDVSGNPNAGSGALSGVQAMTRR